MAHHLVSSAISASTVTGIAGATVGTAAGWFRSTNNLTSGSGYIGGITNSSNQNGFQLRTSSEASGANPFHITAFNGSGAVYDTDSGSTLITDGTWHHLALVFDGATNPNLGYVDGVQVISVTPSATWAIGSAGMTWTFGGASVGGGLTAITCDIADWFFSNVKLTALEIAGLAKGERPPVRGMQSWWILPGGNFPTEYDWSGVNHNNLTISQFEVASFDPPYTAFTPRWRQYNAVSAATTKPFPPFQLRAA